MWNELIFLLLFLICAIPVSIIDIRKLKIPLVYMYACFALGIAFDFFFRKNRILLDLCGSAGLFIVFLAVYFICKKGLGFGDVQYSLICGFFNGFPFMILGSLFASLIGIVFFLILKAKKKNIKENIKEMKIPFAPFMSAGAVIASCIQLALLWCGVDVLNYF